MSTDQFSKKLLEIILLLVGLYAFNTLLVVTAPLFGLGEHLALFVRYSYWVGQIGFGLIIYSKLKGDKKATSIGILSTCIPLFGGLFYLLVVSYRFITR